MSVLSDIFSVKAKKTGGVDQISTSGLVKVGGSQSYSTQSSYTYSPTTSTRTSIVDSRQYSTSTTDARVYAPSYQIAIESPNTTQTKKDIASSSPVQETSPSSYVSPDLSGGVMPSLSTDQTSDQSGSGGVAGGGSTMTLLVLGAIGVGGYILIKRFA